MVKIETSKDQKFLGDYLFVDPQIQMVVVGPLDSRLVESAEAATSPVKLPDLTAAEQFVRERGADAPGIMLVWVADAVSAELEIQLGKAIRAYPYRVVVHCARDQTSSDNLDMLFFSLGFKKLTMLDAAVAQPDEGLWYEYRLSQYKAPPDWLNARFWANPERFDHDEDSDDDYEEFEEFDSEDDNA